MSAAPSKTVRADSPRRWVITAHAIDRYILRVRRGLSRQRAEWELLGQCHAAHFVKPLPNGLELWRGPKPWRCRLRVRRGETLELVTVLEDCDARRRR